MKNFKLLFCIAISLFSVFVVFASDTELPYSSIEKKGIVFSWRINGDFLDIIISAPCKGWISVGIEPNVKMKDADIIIGYIKKGKVFIVDNYGTGPVFHKPDTSLGGEDNIQNKAGKEEKRKTEISFSIPLDSGDAYDKIITKGKHVIILACSDADNFTSKHKIRTKIEIEIK